ncbi:hypothetical protein E2C00_05620 [Streptomyces sp. WAC05374]|uniref:hypothetical protein n=1 Tax=Streptomyces sp. WAC05374 TaxID=2487420 RepID=UPI000F868993|nr:hypothetical protein [Streptomyces sp. WAC05374]RST07610.1 hypothetical protein EF905_31185 [Streptomyces sp. WAC05374]TDF44330.1 hypothetical protein E2B92_16630 [Streptomyces sp. WAC05374]TDF53740.1 hypothetical protein E2C02_18270 [Streptomyces sp. WAC05374]TDF58573.1 hypothetical protein E2C00_05620 [Streptomyces sp. WAC05374]
MNSSQSRTLRWMLIVCLSGVAAGLAVPIALGLLLPEEMYRDLSDQVLFWVVAAVAVALCVAVYVRTRRKSPRPPR